MKGKGFPHLWRYFYIHVLSKREKEIGKDSRKVKGEHVGGDNRKGAKKKKRYRGKYKTTRVKC